MSRDRTDISSNTTQTVFGRLPLLVWGKASANRDSTVVKMLRGTRFDLFTIVWPKAGGRGLLELRLMV